MRLSILKNREVVLIRNFSVSPLLGLGKFQLFSHSIFIYIFSHTFSANVTVVIQKNSLKENSANNVVSANNSENTIYNIDWFLRISDF